MRGLIVRLAHLESTTALIPLMPGELLKGYPSGIAIGERGLWGILPVDAENLAKSLVVLPAA